MSATDIATLATAVFAAVAAGASWATVWQARRERIEAAKPKLSIAVMLPLGTPAVLVQIANHGSAPAHGVEFGVAVDGQFTGGATPRPTLGPGEVLVLRTHINHVTEKDPDSFVSCYDFTGNDLYVWYPNGDHKVYRDLKRSARNRISRAELMQAVAPGFDLRSAEVVRYEVANDWG